VRAGRDRMRGTLLSWLPQDMSGLRLLDAGCGTGVSTDYLAHLNPVVVAIDLSPTLVQLARERWEDDPMSGSVSGHIEFLSGDMLDPALGYFDHMVAMDSLIHYDLPDLVRARCGTTRREQLGAFINGMITATGHTGRIGMVPDMAEALALFRRFNYDAIYHRPESRHQARSVIDMLRPLVEHYIAHPHLLPAHSVEGFDPGSERAATEAVNYVGGMTDRFACKQAVALLDYPRERLPQGIDTLLAG